MLRKFDRWLEFLIMEMIHHTILTWFLQHSCLSAELSLRSGDPHATLSTPSAHCPSENHKSLSSWTETFRSKITNYSDFRNGKVLSRDQCLGRCSLCYGGQYKQPKALNKLLAAEKCKMPIIDWLLVSLRCWRWIGDDDWWRGFKL